MKEHILEVHDLQLRNLEHDAASHDSSSGFPLVSVIISNYNFGQFLSEAVDSALEQTYTCVEVVVVDDGSTDSSHEIITNYGDRIVPVLKENGGQASACNVGFRVSKGEIAIFLDADDVLLPDTIERVVCAFRSRPGVAKVQYRVKIIDATGGPSGAFVPPAEIDMPSGDLRRRLIEANDYVWPPTSGNAFATEVLSQIMPIPEAVYQGMPDVYLCNLSPVLGGVLSLEGPGSLYRIHGMNSYSESDGLLNLDLLRKQILAIADSHMWQKYWFST